MYNDAKFNRKRISISPSEQVCCIEMYLNTPDVFKFRRGMALENCYAYFKVNFTYSEFTRENTIGITFTVTIFRQRGHITIWNIYFVSLLFGGKLLNLLLLGYVALASNSNHWFLSIVFWYKIKSHLSFRPGFTCGKFWNVLQEIYWLNDSPRLFIINFQAFCKLYNKRMTRPRHRKVYKCCITKNVVLFKKNPFGDPKMGYFVREVINLRFCSVIK